MSTEQQDTNKAIKERLESIFPNPNTASSIASMISSPRPAGWSKKSNAPYFKQIYAEEIRAIIDQQIENNKDIVFQYHVWCNKLNISKLTLYNRVNQSLLFLFERLDPEGKYKKWYETVAITCPSDLGIVIAIIKRDATKSLTAEFIVPRAEMPVWKRELDDWLESSDKAPFVKEHLALTKEEMHTLKSQFENLQGIMFEISHNSINLVKL